ncbi:hypothetical protein [Haloactinomyces albus]|uniref:Uncharacterized protein n=1 Tax=Haloactinomyces albus TaxID=1352928 RepID=A0AAE3Z9J8_9ACTN|nr:hypothetical protein [Haloactinomyces albus]MDR7299820.1 hypothetical protein [Haloactinomyces albus]
MTAAPGPGRPTGLYVSFKFARPVIEQWSLDHDHLREITTADVTNAVSSSLTPPLI